MTVTGRLQKKKKQSSAMTLTACFIRDEDIKNTIFIRQGLKNIVMAADVDGAK